MNSEEALAYAKAHKQSFIDAILKGKTPEVNKKAIFMAGSPGAGKTEVATSFAGYYPNYVIIDADDFRSQFPGYDGTNSSVFQKASSWLVEQSFRAVIEQGYSFILDATFAILSSNENIRRALRNNYQVTINYVYQDPIVAWEFTKAREKLEGRVVPKATFINAYFQSRENIRRARAKYPEVLLNVVIKNYENTTSDTLFLVDNIDLLLPQTLTRENLEEMIDD